MLGTMLKKKEKKRIHDRNYMFPIECLSWLIFGMVLLTISFDNECVSDICTSHSMSS